MVKQMNIITKTEQPERNWRINYEELKADVSFHGHMPDKHKVENSASYKQLN